MVQQRFHVSSQFGGSSVEVQTIASGQNHVRNGNDQNIKAFNNLIKDISCWNEIYYVECPKLDRLKCLTNNHSQHEDLYGDKGSFDKSCLKNISCEAHFSWDFGSKSFLAFKLQYFQSRSTPGQVFKARVEIEITFTFISGDFSFSTSWSKH